nr:unnamed protein product [Spirometra erinaceieuropaei]
MPTHIPRESPRRTPLDVVRQQPDNAYFSSNSHPCRKLSPTAPSSPPIILSLSRRHQPSTSSALPNPSDQLRQHHDISHPLRRWDNIRHPIIRYPHHQ